MIRKSKEMARTPEIINDLAFHASQVLIESINRQKMWVLPLPTE